jgi:hypothetical protein
MSPRKIRIGEQIAAVGVSRRALNSSEKPNAREIAYLVDCLDAAQRSLAWLRDHEDELRAYVAARKERGAVQ